MRAAPCALFQDEAIGEYLEPQKSGEPDGGVLPLPIKDDSLVGEIERARIDFCEALRASPGIGRIRQIAAIKRGRRKVIGNSRAPSEWTP